MTKYIENLKRPISGKETEFLSFNFPTEKTLCLNGFPRLSFLSIERLILTLLSQPHPPARDGQSLVSPIAPVKREVSLSADQLPSSARCGSSLHSAWKMVP